MAEDIIEEFEAAVVVVFDSTLSLLFSIPPSCIHQGKLMLLFSIGSSSLGSDFSLGSKMTPEPTPFS